METGSKTNCRKLDGTKNTTTNGSQHCKPNTEHQKANHTQRLNRPAAYRGSDDSATKQPQQRRRVGKSRRGNVCRGAPLIVVKVLVCVRYLLRYSFIVEESRRRPAYQGVALMVVEMRVRCSTHCRGNECQVCSVPLISENACHCERSSHDISRNAVHSKTNKQNRKRKYLDRNLRKIAFKSNKRKPTVIKTKHSSVPILEKKL